MEEQVLIKEGFYDRHRAITVFIHNENRILHLRYPNVIRSSQRVLLNMTMNDASDVSLPFDYATFQPSICMSRRIVRCNF